MGDDVWQPMIDRLGKLKATWPGSAWTWDGRFSTVASQFTAALEPAVRASAVLALTRGWTVKTLASAPEALRELCERTGGLRAGQRLLAGDSDELFGLWWPWGSGENITLRIGVSVAEVTPRLRATFGV